MESPWCAGYVSKQSTRWNWISSEAELLLIPDENPLAEKKSWNFFARIQRLLSK